MAGYYDSSLILSVVLGQGDRDALLRTWNDEPVRVSSVLLRPECIVSARRFAAAQSAEQQVETLVRYLADVTYKPLDDSIADLVLKEIRLAGCRTLDAVHMATALWFRPHLDEPLRVCTLDLRLRALARRLDFAVLPELVPGEAP